MSSGDTSGCLPALGIVADDLTGAGDCAVKFAEAGWQLELEVGGGVAQLAPGGAIAVTTDVRARAETDAMRRTAAAVTAQLRAGAERLYIKVDSTLRGSVRGQITGALQAWAEAEPEAFALVCPAYPAMGRTVVNGELHVDGEPCHLWSSRREAADRGLARAPVGLDAVAVRAARPAEAEWESVRLSGASLEDDIEQALEAGRRSRVVLVDAADDADLDRLASVLAALGRRALPVGSAGLAGAIARRARARTGAPHPSSTYAGPAVAAALVAVSSRHPATTAQLDLLVREWGTDERVRVITTPREALGLRDDTVIAREVADRLGADVERLLSAGPVEALVLVGGDGALAVLKRLGATSVRIYGSAAEGVPLGVVRGGALDGVAVVTKSGGFGEPTTLHDLVRQLIGGTAHETQHTTEQDLL